jgi:CRISPR-associated protein Csm5
METIKLRCEIISPVHIGTGQDIDPFNYIIKDQKLYYFSLEKFLISLPDSKRVDFESIIDAGDLLDLRKFITNNINLETDTIYSVPVTSFVESFYTSRMETMQNRLLVHPFIRSGDKLLIPASTLKGSIRTAILSVMANRRKIAMPRGFKEEVRFENKILGNSNAKDDLFRSIKIQDAYLEAEGTVIRHINNISQNDHGELKNKNIQVVHEVTQSVLTGKPIFFDTVFSIDKKLQDTGFLRKKIFIEEVISSCRSFYIEKMEDEHRKFYENNESESSSLLLLNTPLKDNECFIRIGRFVGVESVTLDYYRNPRPPGKKNIWGTSRNLAEGIFPMGWLKLSFNDVKLDKAKIIKIKKQDKTKNKKTTKSKTSFKNSGHVDLSVLKNKFAVKEKNKG